MHAFHPSRLDDSKIAGICTEHVEKIIPILFSSQKKSPYSPSELEIIKEIVLEMVSIMIDENMLLGERRMKNWKARHLSCIPVFSSFFLPFHL